MAFVDPTTPNLADFITFAQGQGFLPNVIPANSEYFGWALEIAQDIVLYVPQITPILYVLAVYNYGTHRLVKIAQDQPGYTFFSDLRVKYKLLSFIAGVVQSSSDETTSQSLAIGEGMSNLTMSGLDMIKTPWGREAFEYMQQYGPNVTGVS